MILSFSFSSSYHSPTRYFLRPTHFFLPSFPPSLLLFGGQFWDRPKRWVSPPKSILVLATYDMATRIETDTMGEVHVPSTRYWGAQTERSRTNFKIGPDGSMPRDIIHAFAYLKKAAASTNADLKVLSVEKAKLIGRVCDEILSGALDDEFPLVIWQTGSGTQSNMNVNEVIAYRGHVLNGGSLSDSTKFLHPNDDVNKSQSRCVFIYISSYIHLYPSIYTYIHLYTPIQ